MGNGSYWDAESGTWSVVQVDSPFDKAKVFVLPAEPTTGPMRTGDLFIDSDTNRLKYRNGSTWVDLTSGLEVVAMTDVSGLVAALAAKAPLASPTFTGTVAGITKAMVGLSNVDNTTDALKPVSTATQTALNLKANSTHAHATTDITGLTATATELNKLSGVISTITVSEINFLDGVTNNIQSQINAKASTSHTHTVASLTDLTVTAAELNFVDGVTSSIQTQLNATHSASNVTDFAAAVDLAVSRTTAVASTSLSFNSLPTDGLYTELMLGTQPNGPGGGYYYVHNYCFAGGSITQMCYPYVATDPIAYRSRYSGVWTAWNYSGGPAEGGTIAASSYYMKFPDGTLILRGNHSFPSAAGSGQSFTWTFPIAFVGELPMITLTPNSTAPENISMGISSLGLSSVIIQFYRSTAASTGTDFMATGRWK